MAKKLLFIFSLLLFCIYSISEEVTSISEITSCGDGAEWPPYTYYKRNSKGIKTDELTGYTVDVLKEIFKRNNIVVKFTMPPWQRCLHDVLQGNRSQIALDASHSAKREKKYIFTDWYYEITPMYFYDKKRFPNGLKIRSMTELFRKGSVCGLMGYNYVGFGDEINNNNIDRGAKNFDALTSKLIEKRCVAFLARYEILKGFKHLGKDYFHKSRIGFHEVPNAKKDKFYLLISRNIPNALYIKKMIDEEIQAMREDGTLNFYLRKNVD